MSPSLEAGVEAQVARFCRQFRQLEPRLDYPDGTVLLDDTVQTAIHQQLFADDAPTHPPPRYELRVLKELIARIEASIQDWDQHEVSELLMARLSQLLCLPLPSELDAAQQKSRVVYCLSLLSQDSGAASRPEITILESRSLLSAAGTTGLRTWEASLHLGQYLCANPSLVRGKQVLELGAGTGYLSVLCAKFLDASYVVASDGSDDVINNLPDSFYLNNLQGSDKIVPMDLKWGHALVGTEEQAWNAGRQVDLVLGADVTYDQSIIPALVGTMHELVDLFPDVAIVIAATERNKDTFRAFQDACAKSGFLVSHILFPVLPKEQQTGPFYNDQTPIHICQLTKAES